MSAFFAQIFQDKKFLLPYLQEYFNNQNSRNKEKLLVILKSIHKNNPDVLKNIRLSEKEKNIYNLISIPDITDNIILDPIELDMNWASFFATGEIKYIENIISSIKLVQKESQKMIGNAAIWSLSSNCKQHDLVKAYCISIYNSKDLDDFTKHVLAQIINGPSNDN